MSFGVPVRNGLGLGLTPSTMLSSGQPGGRPAMFLNFVGATTLDSRVTFSRTSNATLVDSTGKLTYAPNNLVLNSEAFDASTWTKTRATISANTIAAPNGTLTADKLVEDTTATSTHLIQMQSNFTAAVAGTTYIISGYAKAGERTAAYINMGVDNGVFAGQAATFNFSTGVISGQTGTATFTMTDVGNGWYRWAIAATAAASATPVIRFQLIGTGGSVTYTGDGTSGLYIWGAQLEAVTYQTTPSTYNSTSPANLLGYTQEFDNAAWTKTATTVSANVVTAPDGTTSADKLVEDATTSVKLITWTQAITVGTPYVISMYAKEDPASAKRYLSIYANSGFTGVASYGCTFDLGAGTVTLQQNGFTGVITPAGNGWYRCTVFTTAATATTAGMRIALSNSSTGAIPQSYTGDGTSGIYIWGAQLANSGSVDPYVYNPAAALTSTAYYGPRFDYDPATLVSKGLLIEEQRTNLFLNSKLDGTNLATQNVTTTATAYTISFYGTGTITLTGTSTAGPIVGTGAYPARTTLTFTPTAGTLTCTVTGTVQYAQIEAGAFATSYIPTVAATVTRAADIATMTGTNFSSWYNQSEGTIVASVDTVAPSGANILSFQDGAGASTNRHQMNVYTTCTATVVGGVVQANLGTNTSASVNMAYAYKTNDFAASVSGGTAEVDTSGTVPSTLAYATLGKWDFGTAASLNGHIRSISYYPHFRL